jgi:hypothetical protein
MYKVHNLEEKGIKEGNVEVCFMEEWTELKEKQWRAVFQNSCW